MKRKLSVDEHMNNYTMLLTDLVNVDVMIDEEDKAVILLNSLPDEEYETFILSLINGRQKLDYNKVSVALINYEVRRQDRLSSHGSTSAEALAVRDRGSNRKGKGDHRRSKSRSDFRDLKKNQCALCKELGHWKLDCPKVKGKRRSQRPRQISHRWSVLAPVLHRRMDRTQTHRYSLSLLLLLLLITQIILSGP